MFYNSILLRTAAQPEIDDVYRNPAGIQIGWFYRTLSILEEYLDVEDLTELTPASLGMIKTDLLNIIKGFRKIKETGRFEPGREIYSLDAMLDNLRKARNVIYVNEGIFSGDELEFDKREAFFDNMSRCREHLAEALTGFRMH